jgi:acyl-CoA dehydrogenase
MSDSELTQIAETVDAMLTGVSAAGPRPGPGQVDESALDLLAEAGLRRVALPESAGGSDGQLEHLAVVLKRLAFHAVDVPLLEDHLAAELLAAHKDEVPEGILTVASRNDLVAQHADGRWTVSGRCWQVPWGRSASDVVAFARSEHGPVLVVLPITDEVLTFRQNLAGEPRDGLTYDAVTPVTAVARVADDEAVLAFRSRVLVYRSLTMLGAGERALEMTTTHVGDRTQFGRALAHRQVVQHYVAEMFGALTATRAACDAAIAGLVGGNRAATLAASLATRIEADRMASLVARLAHQLHGAMGFTQEHPLQLATMRLASWRQDDLSEVACALELSRLVPDLGGPWNALTDRGRV